MTTTPSKETLEAVALRIFDTYAASGIAAEWAKGINWHDVKRMAENSEAYAKVRNVCLLEAKAAFTAVMQLKEVRELVDAAFKAEHDLAVPLYLRELLSQALRPFTPTNEAEDE